MKIGKTQFVGSRLREAREARALPAIGLASLIGVSRQAVSQYENDQSEPSPEVLKGIVRVLNIPLRFFLKPRRVSESGPIFYRSLSSASSMVRVRAERRYEWLRDVVGYLRTFIDFPTAKLPEFDAPIDPNYITNEAIEKIATATRRFWGLGDGPISNVVLLMENNGIIMARHRLDCDSLDAFSEWRDGDIAPYVILGNDKLTAVRSRFDAAHELAHLILHRRVPKSTLKQKPLFAMVEDQAFRFASAFLLPEVSFATAFRIPSLDTFKSLKATWGASIGAMIKRSETLGLIGPEQTQNLWINRTRRGWRISEPLDDVLEIENPRFLRRSLDLLLQSGRLVGPELESLLGLDLADIEAVCGLLPGELQDHEGTPIRLIQPKNTGTHMDSPWRIPSSKKF